jgi:hypothetical protein
MDMVVQIRSGCRDGSKNYHSPISHSRGRLINITKEREGKLKKIGI